MAEVAALLISTRGGARGVAGVAQADRCGGSGALELITVYTPQEFWTFLVIIPTSLSTETFTSQKRTKTGLKQCVVSQPLLSLYSRKVGINPHPI